MTYTVKLVPEVEKYLSAESLAAFEKQGTNITWLWFDEDGEERHLPRVYFSKRLKLVDGQIEDIALQMMAKVINRCYAEKKIEPCVFLKPSFLPIDDAGEGIFLFYGYSRYTRHELNVWLGNEAFMKLAEMPNSDTTNL